MVLIGTALAVRYWRITIAIILIAALTITVVGLIEGLSAINHLIG